MEVSIRLPWEGGHRPRGGRRGYLLQIMGYDDLPSISSSGQAHDHDVSRIVLELAVSASVGREEKYVTGVAKKLKGYISIQQV
ncbi:hypothetical protein H6P81_015731 [Aristolochia fimbriata]|uniref:Uncharacterized protein n=1 Tax=Aristolochia fimbriata TaxID=158543 RepID=A0AAV7E9D4_ARIFI|nr:hypothetical protein H6P81_015731 [Aristolochia fimbriata]